MGHNTTLIQQKIQGPLHLPALSSNIQNLLKALADEKVSCDHIADVISLYPEISVRLISLANSAWSSPPKPILDIGSCCVRLGLPVIKSVSIAIAVASIFNFAGCPSFNPERFWTRNMMVAEGAHYVANKLPNDPRFLEMKHAAQTAGLLHNLGLLWLTDEFPKETNQAFEMHAQNPATTINQALHSLLGIGYVEVNALLAKQWKLPELLVISMAHHLDPDYRGDAWELSQLVHVITQMASAIDEGSIEFPENALLESLGIDKIQQASIYQQLLNKHEKIREMAVSLFIRKN